MTDRNPPSCRFVAEDQPRVLRTHLKDCNTSGCGGCRPCEERHCAMPHCPGKHLEQSETQACATCVGKTRTDLGMILSYCQSETIVEELLNHGPWSQAAWVAGPTADVTKWHQFETKALAAGTAIAKGWLEDNQHEYHPLWVLGCWDLIVRQYYGQDTMKRLTLARAGAYIDEHLTDLARDPGIDFAILSRDLHQTRTMLELVLPVEHGPQKGAPCPTCGEYLEKVYDIPDTSGASDRWHCKPCKKWWTEGEYQLRVGQEYLGNAAVLTASQIKHQYGIPEGTVYRWGLPTSDTDGNEIPPVVRKRGRNDQGLQLYDVADVKAQIARRNKTEEKTA